MQETIVCDDENLFANFRSKVKLAVPSDSLPWSVGTNRLSSARNFVPRNFCFSTELLFTRRSGVIFPLYFLNSIWASCVSQFWLEEGKIIRSRPKNHPKNLISGIL